MQGRRTCAEQRVLSTCCPDTAHRCTHSRGGRQESRFDRFRTDLLSVPCLASGERPPGESASSERRCGERRCLPRCRTCCESPRSRSHATAASPEDDMLWPRPCQVAQPRQLLLCDCRRVHTGTGTEARQVPIETDWPEEVHFITLPSRFARFRPAPTSHARLLRQFCIIRGAVGARKRPQIGRGRGRIRVRICGAPWESIF